MHRFSITERPCAQLQDSGAPEGYRRKEPFKKKGERCRVPARKPARGAPLRLMPPLSFESGIARNARGLSEEGKKESAFRRPQIGQNQVREGTPALGGLLEG